MSKEKFSSVPTEKFPTEPSIAHTENPNKKKELQEFNEYFQKKINPSEENESNKTDIKDILKSPNLPDMEELFADSNLENIKEQIKKLDISELEKYQSQISDKLSRFITEIKDSAFWQENIVASWENFSPADQERLYQTGKPQVLKSNSIFVVQFPDIVQKVKDMYQYDSIKLKMLGSTVAPSIRSLIKFNMLPVSDEIKQNIGNDIENDSQTVKNMLTLAQVLVTITNPSASKEIKKLKNTVLALEEIKTEIAHKQHQN